MTKTKMILTGLAVAACFTTGVSTSYAESSGGGVEAQPADDQDSDVGALANPRRFCSNTTRCLNPGPTGNDHVWFPGGRLSIDADVSGSGGQARWDIFNSGGTRLCYSIYNIADPPRSWTCDIGAQWIWMSNVTSGAIANHDLGMRW